MTKDVIVTVSGLHYDEQAMQEGMTEPIEVMAPAAYYFKNGKHYILYEEVVEGMPGTIKNRIKIQEGKMLEVVKSGITNSRMIFEKDRIAAVPYATPFGEIVLGTYTKQLDMMFDEDRIEVYARYSLDADGEKVSECDIRIKVEANDRKGSSR